MLPSIGIDFEIDLDLSTHLYRYNSENKRFDWTQYIDLKDINGIKIYLFPSISCHLEPFIWWFPFHPLHRWTCESFCDFPLKSPIGMSRANKLSVCVNWTQSTLTFRKVYQVDFLCCLRSHGNWFRRWNATHSRISGRYGK